MSFHPLPLFGGDFFDNAAKLAAASAGRSKAAGTLRTAPSEAWRQMVGLGWQGVLVEERRGGVGGSLADCAALVDAVSRHALTVPIVERCGVVPAMLSRMTGETPMHGWLERIAAGDASVCPVLGRPVELDADGRLHGTLALADLDEPATHLLLEALERGASRLVLLATPALDERATGYEGADLRSSADIDVAGLRVAPQDVIARDAEARRAIASGRLIAMLLGCVELVAMSGALIEQSIGHLDARVQFDTRLSTFQALRHRVVDLYVAYESARGVVRPIVAQWPFADERAAEREVLLAKLYTQSVARWTAECAIQLHGGMGMSRETLAARLAVNALAGATRHGDRAQCLDALAARFSQEATES